MPSFSLNTTDTVAKTLSNNQVGLIGVNGALQVFGPAITTSGAAFLSIAGSVQGFNNTIDATNGTSLTLIVTQTGSITGFGPAVVANLTTESIISNSGTIQTNGDVLVLTADAQAPNGLNHNVQNSGVISGNRDAIVLQHNTLGVTEILNSGTIMAGRHAIDNILTTSGITLVRNTGEIIAGQDVNTGSGLDFAYRGGSSADYLVNQGLINGLVDMGPGADFYNAAGGTTAGAVRGGTGNDTLQGGDSADRLEGDNDADLLIGRGGDDVIDGAAGSDMMLGGAGNDSMTGGNNNDTMNGNAGDDTMEGGAGNDILVGQDGSDLMDGGALDDTMDGGNGDDILEGDTGNDILRGRAGEDDLAGGLGRDFLTGGQDADVFVFRSLSETVVGAMRDQILDFEQGLDNIVVAGLSPGVFEFRGTAGFAPSGNPELRLIETATGSTIVQLDANGDGTADAEIRVANVTGLTADDFTL
ncbi:calcium-binding protein [uncultured Mameliella sp.]|uniref:calcium-binding protein n=1 Tax=uncultured Mameliella sp. TaxID=1447087 RepID=UPI0026056E70|nr:calcium-binding protein [uncultured Mameliella sp.]